MIRPSPKEMTEAAVLLALQGFPLVASWLKREAVQEARKAGIPKRKIAHRRAEPTAPEQRQPRERDNTYLQWIRRLPCVACVKENVVQAGPTEAAHVRCGYSEAGWSATGMQQKPHDWRTAPLCDWHHRDGPSAQHKGNERAWWANLGIFPPSLCGALKEAFEGDLDGLAVIRVFAKGRA